MKRLIGWLANFYPQHLFYAQGFGEKWDMHLPDEATRDVHVSTATSALLGTAVAAGKHIETVGGKMSAVFTSVTNGGKSVGSFQVTVERLADPTSREDQHTEIPDDKFGKTLENVAHE